MKKFLPVMFLTFCFHSMASENFSIKLTSFGRISNNIQNLSAEVCGYVQGPVIGDLSVELIVDQDSNRPGYYHTKTARNGKFCAIVATYAGTVMAKLRGIAESNSVNLDSGREISSEKMQLR
ncbi:MAG: hypothetical protein H6622_09310 [Halobacteriovoraceae bacterium]|nr:hypothetical protein [Halobacteriovoraceae bacterium]